MTSSIIDFDLSPNLFFIERPEIVSRTNDKSPMKMGEIRTFKIDKNKKKECKLPGKGIIEIEIIKEESSVAEFALRLAEFALHEAYLLCDNGYINYVRTEGKAEKCE